jgi:hypothetical protein
VPLGKLEYRGRWWSNFIFTHDAIEGQNDFTAFRIVLDRLELVLQRKFSSVYSYHVSAKNTLDLHGCEILISRISHGEAKFFEQDTVRLCDFDFYLFYREHKHLVRFGP